MNFSSFVNKALSYFDVKLIRLKKENQTRPGNVYPLDESVDDGIDIETKKILNLLAYTKTNTVTYNAKGYPSGYHTLKIDGHTFRGQRDPAQRLEGVPFDFDGATVLDLGCNQGGMLLSIADRIHAGVGVDFDYKMVNAANRVRAHKRLANLNYYVFDLEKENLELLRNFFSGNTIDMVFLLSVCMWIKNWKSVIDSARSISTCLLFESNGSPEQQFEQEAYLRSSYADIILVREASTDDPGQQRRRLFLCRTKVLDEARAGAIHDQVHA
jgi:Methyltransferase domain.